MQTFYRQYTYNMGWKHTYNLILATRLSYPHYGSGNCATIDIFITFYNNIGSGVMLVL